MDSYRIWRNEQGFIHRVHRPAIEIDGQYGRKEWWLNGKRHRTDGPAVKYNDDRKEWWLNGDRHRFDGPAYQSHIKCEYWIYGIYYTEERFNKITGICRKFGNKLKARLRKKYEKELLKTNVCNEINLYKIITSYVI